MSPAEQEAARLLARSDGLRPTATLARNAGGAIVDPGPGRIVVAIEDNRVAVETFNANGSPEFLPFNVIVAC